MREKTFIFQAYLGNTSRVNVYKQISVKFDDTSVTSDHILAIYRTSKFAVFKEKMTNNNDLSKNLDLEIYEVSKGQQQCACFDTRQIRTKDIQCYQHATIEKT